MTKKILFVDPLSEPGHFNFNHKFMDYFDGFDISWICSKGSNTHENSVFEFNDKLLNKKSRLIYIAFQIIILFKSLLMSKKYDAIVFMSYNIFALFLVSKVFIFFKIPVYAIEHNTFVPDNRLKRYMFSKLDLRITHICLAPYIKDEIVNKFGKKAVLIWHPFSKYKTEEIESNVFFMPSSTIPLNVKADIFDVFEQQSDYLLITKGEVESSTDKIKCNKFFDDYEKIISSSRCIVIPQSFDYRVSGVFFESINSNAILYMSDCIFSQEMKKIFPEKICIINDWSKMNFDFVNRECSYEIDIEEFIFESINNVRKEFLS
ncbi:hypothetical protein KS868_001349 [Vibrio parahaemolyticus]|nr:hypothetical protein [Vibrio parahaemolyticus]